MTQSIRFVLLLHNHQPIGNFDHVFEQAYQDSYLPFLEVFEPYDELRIGLHTSGPLMEWLDRRHPEYLDRLGRLVHAGRIEIVGGAFYEPILPSIPPRDRRGQIASYTEWLQNRLNCHVEGMWVPERVWEQSLTADIAAAGIRYTLLDDFHFKNAGFREEELYSYYVTEDQGQMLRVFPGSERLRYLIPFQPPEATIDYLRQVAESRPNSVLIFGDDGEKLGTWPGTKEHVYDNGWLRQFFDILCENRDWIDVVTPGEAIRDVPPMGKIYVPEGSYREMTEWALPADRQVEFEHTKHILQDSELWDRTSPFVRGANWRNFKVRYPETDEMYARMMMVSDRLLQQSTEKSVDPAAKELLERAKTDVYRAQCNCSYWHGAFGGVYLPHLRNAVYQHLISAENLLDQAAGRGNQSFLEVHSSDVNFDGEDEVVVSTDCLAAFFQPACGGRLYELDVRSICHNLLATLSRRPEAYHDKVRGGATGDDADVASIHDRVVFKQDGLDQLLQYDSYLRKALHDHFYDADITLEQIKNGSATERGDFLSGRYRSEVSQSRDRAIVTLVRQGRASDAEFTISKSIAFAAGSSTLEVTYQIDGLPTDRPLHFAVEWNFAGMPSGADDRYFYDADRNTLGQLGTQLDLQDVQGIGLVDEWLGIDLGLSCNRATNWWTLPVQSVSQSEGGFEAVHQSVAVMPHWLIQGDAQGRWGMTMALSIDTTLAERKNGMPEMATVS
ncbi:MAG: alpha-amylase/4-alpha-glucanotransferase domain-containing protein [Pirellulales bacterium]|nr:alpha-amylase/4-alpha-glucanotransferase domain-containing protein [Pirellulales bacterium]